MAGVDCTVPCRDCGVPISQTSNRHFRCLSCRKERNKQTATAATKARRERDRKQFSTERKRVCWLEKACRICGVTKPLIKFPINKQHTDSRESRCSACKRAALSKSALSNQRASMATWRSTESAKQMHRTRQRIRRQDPVVRIGKRMAEMLRRALNGAKQRSSWTSIVPYTADELRAHLERLFVDGMTWDAFMRGEIHIDHVKPQAAFKFVSKDDHEFAECWALSNLQPLWAADNIRKSARLDFSQKNRFFPAGKQPTTGA